MLQENHQMDQHAKLNNSQQDRAPKPVSVSDHLTNERTFLAWVRTSIGIMGFGFVVVKFSLFVRQISIALNATSQLPPNSGYSQAIGLFLVALGGIVLRFAFIYYQKTNLARGILSFRPADKIKHCLFIAADVSILEPQLCSITCK